MNKHLLCNHLGKLDKFRASWPWMTAVLTEQVCNFRRPISCAAQASVLLPQCSPP